jgi:pyruvate formate lyase activating enzyme
MPRKEALMYEVLAKDIIHCKLCPKSCYIAPNKRGFCKVRENDRGRLFTLAYGETTARAIDPIEKKPLFNFWPGSLSFSISTISCTFSCVWCQNWNISQVAPGEIRTEEISPENVVKLAKKYGCRSISYTYNEPFVWYEFIMDTAKIAQKENILNVMVTNGYVTLEALDQIAPFIDAANVDIKGFTEGFYRKYCAAELKPVLKATTAMKDKGIHVEVTNLIISDLNDNSEEIKEMCKWHVENLGKETPLHFSRFYPNYRLVSTPETPVGTLEKAQKIALEMGLHYVYVGNVPGHGGENTYCPKCKALLIERNGFDITEWRLAPGKSCPECGFKPNIIGEYEARSRVPHSTI